jgi:hypothetical protein
MLGNLAEAISSGPYPKRGTFLYFGGPTNNFEDNTDPALMYHVHLASDMSRLRLHVEDNIIDGYEGFSILAASCGGGCYNLAASSLLFDFVTDGQAYKPGGGNWATLSDARRKEDIRPYTRGLAELRALRPVRYKYTRKSTGLRATAISPASSLRKFRMSCRKWCIRTSFRPLVISCWMFWP